MSEQWFEPVGSASGKVSKKLHVRVDIFRYGIRADWTPTVPTKLNKKQLTRYREIRQVALEQAALKVGSIFVVDG
jgi:hypothetical protein